MSEQKSWIEMTDEMMEEVGKLKSELAEAHKSAKEWEEKFQNQCNENDELSLVNVENTRLKEALEKIDNEVMITIEYGEPESKIHHIIQNVLAKSARGE